MLLECHWSIGLHSKVADKGVDRLSGLLVSIRLCPGTRLTGSRVAALARPRPLQLLLACTASLLAALA